MAKLPGINYNRMGVSSLGRQDINAPGSLARAELAERSGLILGVAKLGDAVYKANVTNEAAGISSELTEGMAELNARIKDTKSYKPEELDKLGVSYKTHQIVTKDGVSTEVERDMIPASEVAEQVYKRSAAAMRNTAIKGVNSKVAKLVNTTYAGLYKQGISGAVKHQIAHAHTEAKIKAYVGFEKAVKDGNIEGATMISETALANGTWSEAEYLAKTEPMRDRIANNSYLKELSLANSEEQITALRDRMLWDDDLKHASKKSLYSSLDKAEQRIIKGEEKIAKAKKTEESSVKLTELSSQVISSNIPVPWENVPEVAASLTPTDRKAFIAVNKAVHTGSANTSNPDTLRELTLEVKTLSLPDNETTVFQRRGAVVTKLIAETEAGTISPKDFSTLMDSINKAQDFQYSSPDHKFVDDEIWLLLTGGSRDMISNIMGGGESKVNVTNASHALNKAARESGPDFDPYAWWTKNEEKYLVQAIRINRQELQKDINKGNIIKGTDGFIDMDATMKTLQLKVNRGDMSQDTMNKLLNDAEIRDKADREWAERAKSGKFR